MDEQDKKKIESTDKHCLHFRIEDQSAEWRDCDRVKILVNGVDILAFGDDYDDHKGLTPEKMLQTDLLQPGKCLVGVCSCGDEGCGPYYVDISIDDDIITWDDSQAECQYRFDKTEYTLAIKNLQKILTDYLSGTPYKPTEEDLEEYKKAVYEWLTEKIKVSRAVAESGMKDYEICFEQYLEEHWSVSAVATAILHGF